jgi:hypothetical protein
LSPPCRLQLSQSVMRGHFAAPVIAVNDEAISSVGPSRAERGIAGHLSPRTAIRGPGNDGQGRPPLPNRRHRRPCRCWIPGGTSRETRDCLLLGTGKMPVPTAGRPSLQRLLRPARRGTRNDSLYSARLNASPHQLFFAFRSLSACILWGL